MKRLAELIKQVKDKGIKVEFVPSSKLHDFAAMNWETAKKFEIKDFPDNTVWIDEKFKSPGTTLEATQFVNLKHELHEASNEQNGAGYWGGHTAVSRRPLKRHGRRR